MPLLVNNLFKTFIISTVVAIALNCAYYAYIVHGSPIDYAHTVTKISGATLLLTVIISIMSLPALFLLNANYWNNLWVRISLYFAGSVVFIISVLTSLLNPSDKIFDLITGIVFLTTHAIFYYLATKARVIKK